MLPLLIERARLTNESPLEGLRKILAKPYASHEAIVGEAAQLLKEGGLPSERQLGVNGRGLASLMPDIRKQIALTMASGTPLHEAEGYADRMAINELWASGRASHAKREEAEEHGISLHFPFLDHQVVRASLQLAGYKKQQPHQFKAFLRASLQGSVPDELLERRSKGSYSTEAYGSIRQKAQDFRDFLGHNALLTRLGVIDPQFIHQIITEIELGIPDALLSVPQHAADVEKWLQSRYQVPTASLKPLQVRPAAESIHEPASFPLSLAPHVHAVEDGAGIALYNLKTKELRALHHSAGAIIQVLQQRGQPEDVYQAVRQTLKPELHAHAEALTMKIAATLSDRGFLEPESSRPFMIARPNAPRNAQASEIFYAENVSHSPELMAQDYLAVVSGIRKARKMLESLDLYEITQNLRNDRSRQRWSDERQVTRLLHAGHVIGKYYMNRLTCQELSLAVILAEARRNRRTDWAVGVSADPRGVHAWPEINGEPIRTEHDDYITGKYTKLDSW